MYFDDLLAVLKVNIPQPKPLLMAVKTAARKARLTPHHHTINNSKVLLWHLYQPTQKNLAGIMLAVAEHNNSVTLALVTDAMANQDIAKLLGIKKVSTRISIAPKLKALEQRFNLNNGSDNSPTALNRRSHRRSMGFATGEDISPVCESEILQLISKTRHAIMSINTRNQIITSQLMLDIADPNLAQQLVNINGVVQTMQTAKPQPLLNLAIGLNISELPNLMKNLATYLDEVNFSCRKLEHGRIRLVKQLDINAWFAYSMLAQGVQGASIGLFDLGLRDRDFIPDYLDAYLSVYLDDIEQIATLWEMLPILDRQALPDEGQVITLKYDEIPEDIEVLMTRNQQELRIFTGPKSAQWALAPHTTTHDTAGVIGFDLNLAQTAKKWAASLMFEDVIAPELPCYVTKPLATSAGNPALTMSNRTKFTANGLVFTTTAKQENLSAKAFTPFQVGAYDVAKLGSDCTWKTLSTLNFRTSTQGAIHTWPDASGCITYDGSFRITPEGNELNVMNYYTLIDACKGQTIEQLDEWQCSLIMQNNNTYICAEASENEISLYRFKPPGD